MPCQTDYVVFAKSRLLTAGEKDERMDAHGYGDWRGQGGAGRRGVKYIPTAKGVNHAEYQTCI
jgi:hypothetical protein